MTKKKPKSEHKDPGRPTVITPEIVAKLENAFAQGFNITHACGMADISRDAYYDYIKKNPNFTNKIEWLRSKPYIKSILGINKLIQEGDPQTVRWYATNSPQGKADGFGVRQEITGKDGEPIETSPIVVQFTSDKIIENKPKEEKTSKNSKLNKD